MGAFPERASATGSGHPSRKRGLHFEALQLLPPTRLEPMFDEEGRAIHAVRRCQSVCIRMVCHRDVNACLSIMYVFIYCDGERTLRSSAAPATNAAGADVRRGRPGDSCCAALSKRMYPHGVAPRRQRLFEHHVRLHLLRRGEDTSKLCSSCHQRGWSRCSTRKAERFMLCGAVKAYVSAWCGTATSTLV